MLILPKTFTNLTEWAKRLVSSLEMSVATKDELNTLQSKVDTLEKRIAALESDDS